MMETIDRKEGIDISVKLRWLLLARLFISTFLLGVAAFIEFQGTETVLNTSAQAVSVYYVIAAVYLSSILFIFFQRRFKAQNIGLFFLAVTDLVLITVLVQSTGGADSIYSIFYSLVVIYAALLIGRNSGYAIAALGGLFYLILLCLENRGWLRYLGTDPGVGIAARQLLAKWFVQTVSLFIISFLTSFVADQERKVRKLLVEKEDDFKKLDLLHQHIIESIDAGVLTYDLKGRIKTFNRAAAEITGLAMSEVSGMGVAEIFPGLEEKIRSEGKPARGGNRFEISMNVKGGKKALIGFSISRLMDQAHRHIGEIMIFQDVTALREMERQVEKSRKMALIGEMAAGLAHEMRNPLAAIGGSIQLLKKGLQLSDSDERLMQIILRGKDQVEAFLREFLLLAKPAAQERHIVNVHELITDIIESLRFGHSGIENIDIVHNEVPGTEIMGSRTEVRQALINIIVNAIQSMPDGGRLSINSSLIHADNLKYLTITVEDTGCGIEKENLEKIFEPFFTTKARGTGLGLAIVNRILESHGGWISVESSAGEGTKIELLFPVSHDGQASVPCQEAI